MIITDEHRHGAYTKCSAASSARPESSSVASEATLVTTLMKSDQGSGQDEMILFCETSFQKRGINTDCTGGVG